MVPEGWKPTTLARLSSLAGGHGFPLADQGFTPSGIPFIKVSDLNLPGNEQVVGTWNNAVPAELVADRGWKTHPPGTTVFPKVGAALLTNKRRRLSRPTIIDNNMMAAVPRNGVDSSFLFYLLQTIDFNRYVSPGAVPSVNQRTVGAVEILRPPLPEQQKIAAILSSVDDVIAATRKVIEQTKRVKQGLLQTLMTRGIGHTRFKKTEIGEIPEEWDVVPLGQLVRSGGGIFTDGDWIESKDQDPDGGVRLIQLADIGEYRFLDRSNRWMTVDKAREIGCTYLEVGDLLIARMPDPIGRACAVPSLGYPAVTAVDVVICRPGESVDREWLRLLLNTEAMCDRVLQLATGTTRKRISRKNLSSILIAVPDLAEQSEIAQVVVPLEEQLQLSEASMSQLQRMKRGLMKDLLTGRVRVPLD